MSGDRYLWFAPNAGLWPSFRLEVRLAQGLASAGRDVTMMHCQGVLETYCPVMVAQGLEPWPPSPVRDRVCRDCRHAERTATRAARYATTFLDDFVTPEIERRATALCDQVDERNWVDFELEGIPVGRYATYLAMLHHKLPDVTSSPAAWSEYQSDLRNATRTLLAMPAILDRFEPTHVAVYNPLYPVNRMFTEAATRFGARLLSVTAGGYIPARYDTVAIYHHVSASQTLVDSKAIARSLDTPLTELEVHAVGGHINALMSANDPWVYSSAPTRRPPEEIRAQLGARASSSVAVVLLSSPDETRSSMLVDAEYVRDPAAGYSDIAEFISAAKQAARALPAIDFVMRLHPRLTPNKRESVTSPDLPAILAELEDLPSNVHVNVPGDGVGLYDLVGIADCAVNQSSSSGLEFLALGLPVVSFDPIRQNAYRPQFGPCVGRGRPDLLAAAIAEAAGEGWSLEHVRDAYRWYASSYLRSLLHLAPLAHPVFAEQPTSSPVAESTPSLALRLARVVLPERVRAWSSRHAARRARASDLPDPTSDDLWLPEFLSRIDALGGTVPVWEPLTIVRGEVTNDEHDALMGQVRDVVARLGLVAGPGLGAISALLS